MATSSDIATSLTMDEIPVKLRCAACNRLANDAFRLPCCDQIICGDCQASLPEACPVCLHEPISKDDCKPNKALRTTIKIFMKKKIMERETAKKKEESSNKHAITAATPQPDQTSVVLPSDATAVTDTSILTEVNDVRQNAREPSQAAQVPDSADTLAAGPRQPTEAEKDVPQQSIESPELEIITHGRESTQTADDGSSGPKKPERLELALDPQQSGQNGQWGSVGGQGQGMNGVGFGFDANGLANMGFNGVGDFSQMMQFMPNGMSNAMMGGAFPNMMGMPGMMDPTMMTQGMFGGFGGQGMGMNGMNMGMGFEAGQGAFGGGFNGQPTWNTAQNKFNQNAYGGHTGSGSDFGTNAGYGAGYNQHHQGNFNQMHQYPNNDFHHGHHGQGFQNRGRGRGRGYFNAGRGRGGYQQYNQSAQGNQANYDSYQQQAPLQVTRRGSPQYGEKLEQPAQSSDQDAKVDGKAGGLSAEDQFDKELNPGDADDEMQDPALMPLIPPELPKDIASTEPPAIEKHEEQVDVQAEAITGQDKLTAIESIVSEDVPKPVASTVEVKSAITSPAMPPPSPLIPTGPAALTSTEQPIESSRGTGSTTAMSTHSHSVSQGQGSGYVPNGSVARAHSRSSSIRSLVPPQEPKGLGVEGAPKGPKALREGRPNIGYKGFVPPPRTSVPAQVRPNSSIAPTSPAHERQRSKSRTRSRSPARHHSSHHHHHRHRSTSPSSDSERERRRERHRRHARKYDDEDVESRKQKSSRTRDASLEPSEKRSSHRSRREHEKDKDAERSSHRSHRHRDRSREADADYRSSKKRSLSPEISIFGASRMKDGKKPTSSSHHKVKEEELVSTSGKRRSDDEEFHRDRKRSRRDHDEVGDGRENRHRSEHKFSKRDEKESRSNHDWSPKTPATPVEPEKPKPPPKGPKIDQHAIEREARNAERIARENQRRAMQGGGGGTGKSGGGKVNGMGGRRMSYKYEDEDMTSRVETEREAVRYR